MPRFDRHIFVCENVRPARHPRGCCAQKGSPEVRARFKKLIRENGLRGRVRANSAGCLDQCERGVTVVIYPEGVWYGGVTCDDVDEIFERHVLGDEVVERLVLDAHSRGELPSRSESS
ncbi:MAG: ferredoxin [Candidatus Krumholzibacteriia bacterium]